MSQDRPWWVTSDPDFKPPQEQAMALDDPQPDSTPSWVQALHDRLDAIEAWIKERMSNGQTPEQTPEAPPATEGGG